MKGSEKSRQSLLDKDMKTIIAKSRIVSADIYTESCVLQRKGTVRLFGGVNLFYITGMPSELKPETITFGIYPQVKSYHLSTAVQISQETDKDKVSKIEEIKRTIKELGRKIEIFGIEKDAWETNMDFTNNQNVSVAEIIRYMEESHERLEELSLKIDREQEKLEACKKELKQLEQEYSEEIHSKYVDGICVEAVVEQEGVYEFVLNYTDNKVFWKPFYDIRVDSLAEPAKVCLKGKIQQVSGETWENVKISLYDGKLNISNNRPLLKAWYLYAGGNGYGHWDDASQALDNRETTVLYSAQNPQVQETVQTRRSMVKYELTGYYSVKSGQEGILVDVIEYAIPAVYKYYAVPKAEQNMFLVAELQDAPYYNFIPCNANIYLENTLVGTTFIHPDKMNDVFALSIGRDNRIQVSRKILGKYKTEARFKGSQTQISSYEISVVNRKQENVYVVISDQIPVSRDSNITVAVREYSGAYINQVTGEVMWSFELQPGESRILNLEFAVTYPKDVRLSL